MAESMRTSNRNYAATLPFVEALAHLGLRHVAITPGSRNTPLAFAFAANSDIEDTSHHDERSAAFFALGMAKATGLPVALVSTSGTAAAEYLPAIVEAKYGRTPLIVLTADRPPELRDVGSPQTVDQHGMYGRAVKWFHEAPVPETNPAAIASFSALAGRAWSAAVDLPKGPVHVNFPFRDPMVPIRIEGDALDHFGSPPLPSFESPEPAVPTAEAIAALTSSLEKRKALIVAGPTEDMRLAPAVAKLGAAAGIPIIADPLSGLRAGTHDKQAVISSGDWLARRGDLDGKLRPGIVLRFGAPPTSKSLNSWLASHPDVEQVIVDEAGWRDPGATASSIIRADGGATAALLAERVEPDNGIWLDAWASADTAVGSLLDVAFPSEPKIVQLLQAHLPGEAVLFTASSMPIRVLDAFFRPIDRNLRILGNRGANGIDGLISAALGATLGLQRPGFVYSGDVSMLHDLTALATATRLDIPLTIVLANNDGGGIFHLLPQADFPEHFEKHLGTPHGLNFAKIAAAFGVDHALPETADELGKLIATPATGPRIIEVQTDREESAALLRRMWKRVGEAN